MKDQVKNKRGISLSTQILIGLTFGLFVGLFFGDKASVLAIVGKAYLFRPWKNGVISIENLNFSQFIEIRKDLNRSEGDFKTEAE